MIQNIEPPEATVFSRGRCSIDAAQTIHWSEAGTLYVIGIPQKNGRIVIKMLSATILLVQLAMQAIITDGL